MQQSNLGRKIDIFTIDWLYFFPLFYGASLMVIVAIFRFSPKPDTILWVWLFFGIAYFLIVFALRQSRPRIQLYENGVLVLEKKKQSVWLWSELSRVEGKRQTIRMNMIPMLKSGANWFYTDEQLAFRVGANTGQADILVEYIKSRMAENLLTEMEAKLQKGETVDFGEVKINLEGISGESTVYAWEQVQMVYFQQNQRFTCIRVKIADSNYRQLIGFIDGVQGYVAMGLIDSLRGSKNLRNFQARTENRGSLIRQILMTEFWSILVIITLIFVSGSLILF